MGLTSVCRQKRRSRSSVISSFRKTTGKRVDLEKKHVKRPGRLQSIGPFFELHEGERKCHLHLDF